MSSSITSASEPTSPTVTETPRGRDRTRAFSPVRLRGVGKGLFAKKGPKADAISPTTLAFDTGAVVEVGLKAEETREEEEEAAAVVSSSDSGAAQEETKEEAEALKVELQTTIVQTALLVSVAEDAKIVEPNVEDREPKPADTSPSAPLALPLTPTSLALPSIPSFTLFSPYEISLQIRTMLQNLSPSSVDSDIELAPPPDQTSLLALLGRPEVMNGHVQVSSEKEVGEEPVSVWKCLERLTEQDSLTSIMVSCDIVLDGIPQVTLAEWKDFGGAVVEEAASFAGGGGWSLWPWGRKLAEEEKKAPVSNGGKVVRVWYPSETKMSLHATWWGFSLYFPHPVMLLLDDGQVDTLKRVTAITTGLGYLIKFLPGLIDLGPGMLVALALLSSLIPVISFIASFIAWSWGNIQAHDKGKGVILSATWLCPLLLITRSWDAPTVPPSSPIDIGVVPVQPTLIATPFVEGTASAIAEDIKVIG